MTSDRDIVDRLREQAEWHSDGPGPLHAESADEIERARQELEMCEGLLAGDQEVFARHRAEIERLRQEIAELKVKLGQ
jgi:polyhydroxyalkanoate synthesis regulator phasin